MPQVKSIDVREAQTAVSNCPKIVQDYVRSLEGIQEASRHFQATAIKKVKALADEDSRNLLILFIDQLRDYEHEANKSLHSDERENSEFVDIFLNSI